MDEQPAPAQLRHVWGFATAFLCAALPAVAGIAAFWAGPLAIVPAAAAFVPPLLYAVPRSRPLWERHRNELLVVQALLAYLPFAAFGSEWVAGLPGLLGGMLLLTVASPLSWLLFVLALVVEGVLRIGVVGLPHIQGLAGPTLIFVVPLYSAVAVFGLVRLAGLISDLREARGRLAALTVARERARAAQRLRAAIGDRLDTVTTHAQAASAALPEEPDEARRRLAEAAVEARQALDQVRTMVSDDRREPAASADGGSGPTLAPRLARGVLALVLVALSAQLLTTAIADHHVGPLVQATSVIGVVVIVALQLYHSTVWREGVRPRFWAWTLTAQLVVLALGFFPVLHSTIHGLGGFVAGSALLLLPGRWGWTIFAAVQAAIAVHTLVLPGLDTADVVYSLLMTVTTALVVYGLSRMAGLAVELDETRRDIARMTVVRERLRVAQDAHDLLGLGLSAVALKCDLAARLVGRDDARAQAEIAALVQLAAQAGADVVAVTADGHRISLRAELGAATEALASAGAVAEVRGERLVEQLPDDVDAVLATVLREAITNVLRHSTAQRCAVDLAVEDGVAHLRVLNDGVSNDRARAGGPSTQRGGRGLVNLSARAAAAGGAVVTHASGGSFELSVRVPLGSDGAGGEDALAARDPAHGVDEVVGRAVLDQES
ncbi:sensor histidine kinase [Pseudonocardia sp. TRM90224]|uniref:sensor histidine kinase n=1 Tax=Pseudonocardia sp. TRM90224 TaxID=2812678 RepID=UPI001E39E5F4|nr:histidine kinase [Pseudonocardia sp. TRM90224]